MSDLVETYGQLRRALGGRHAFDEDAALTPIFHSLRRAEPRPDEAVDEFRRDPLTAPIPVQAFAAAATSSPRLARTGRRRARHERGGDGGRHTLLAG